MMKSLKPVIYPPFNVKMPTIVDILTFMSRINFMLSGVEQDLFSKLGPSTSMKSHNLPSN